MSDPIPVSEQMTIHEHLERLRMELANVGAPVWTLSDPMSIPPVIAELCRPGTQRRAWAEEVSQMDLPVDARLKVAFGWNLSNLDEMVRDQQLGESYGKDLQREGVPDAWRSDWVPILWHNDGLVVVDDHDQAHRLWWEGGVSSLTVDLFNLVELLISLLANGTYVWDSESAGFGFGQARGHPILDF